MTVKYHVNDKGNPGVCKAETEICPFGGVSGLENHFSTQEEARNFYERSQQEEALESFSKVQMSPLEKFHKEATEYKKEVLDRGIENYFPENPGLAKKIEKELSLSFKHPIISGPARRIEYREMPLIKSPKRLRSLTKYLSDDDEALDQISNNPNIDSVNLNMLASIIQNKRFSRYKKEILGKIINNEKTTTKTLDMIYYNSDKESVNFIKKNIVKNPKVSEYVLSDIINNNADPDNYYDSNILFYKEKLSLSLQYDLAKVYKDEPYFLAESRKIDPRILGMVYNNSLDKPQYVINQVFKELKNNPNTPQEIKDKISYNESSKEYYSLGENK